MNLHHGLTGLALAAIFTATAPNLATAQQTGTIRGEVG